MSGQGQAGSQARFSFAHVERPMKMLDLSCRDSTSQVHWQGQCRAAVVPSTLTSLSPVVYGDGETENTTQFFESSRNVFLR